MTSNQPLTVISNGTPIEEREARLSDGADELESKGRQSIFAHPRFLLTVSAALMTLGLLIILLGWIGAARSTLVEEQIPYLISGGLFGLALALIGAVTLFAHWQTVQIKERRAQEIQRRADHREMMALLRSIANESTQENSNGRARGSRAQRPIRRTSGG